jgi:serine phosphatase RsbU (regulator of sigma subunit)/ABC-type amino acid transport substrate-binding protein
VKGVRVAIKGVGLMTVLGLLLGLWPAVHFGLGADLALSYQEIVFTSEEQKWIRQHKTIRLGVDPDWPPIEFVGTKGGYRGVASEVVRIVSERIGIRMEVKPGLTWSQVMARVKTKQIDVLPCAARTNNREDYLRFTRPYLNIPVVIVTRTDAAYIGGLDDLYGKTVAVIRNYQLYERLPRDHPDITVKVVDSAEEALRCVSHGEAYAFAGNLATTSYLISKLGITNLKVAAPTPYSYVLSFAVRRDWPELVDILNKALSTITQNERTEMAQRWISLGHYGIDYVVVLKGAAIGAGLILVILAWNVHIRRQREALRQSEEQIKRALAESNRHLSEAAQYVTTLLPEPIDRGSVRTDWRFLPSSALGGDCLGYHWLDDDFFTVYLVDVSGHGVSAALLAVTITNVLRSRSLTDVDFREPGQVLSSLNNTFPMEQQNDMYFTMWYGVLQLSTRSLTYASAGHPPALLLSSPSAGEVGVDRLQTRNLFVGGMSGIEFKTARTELTGPCTVYIFSDGLYEIELEDGTLWGLDNLERTVSESFAESGSVLDRLLGHVVHLNRGDTLEDDLSILEMVID